MKNPVDYDRETRDCATMTIIAGLLAMTTSGADDKAKLAIAILGHDPREE